MLGVPPGVPSKAWLEVQKKFHELAMRKADMLVARYNREREFNFLKKVFERFFPIAPDIMSVLGDGRYPRDTKALMTFTVVRSILQTYCENT